MGKGKLILICQSGGQFVASEDGTLSYDGGDANAVNINHETIYEDLKMNVAEMYNLDENTISMKYFLPGNRRNLITLKSDKDLKRMLDFHGTSVTADIFIYGKEGFSQDALKKYSTKEADIEPTVTVSHLLTSTPLNSVGPNTRSRHTISTAADDTSPVINSENLVDVNVTIESPSGTTTDSAPSVHDEDSDYAPRNRVVCDAFTCIPVSLDTTPADTVKKRRRTTWKIGSKGTFIVADADNDGAKRAYKKSNNSGCRALLRNELEIKGERFTNDDLQNAYDIVIHEQHFPQSLVDSWKDGITGVGQDFKNVKEFRNALQKYAIAHHFVYKLKKSDTNRASGICVADGCPWSIHASWIPASQVCRIKKFNDLHTCGKESWKSVHPGTGRNWLVSIIKDRLRESPHRKARDIASGILQDFGIELTYTQVWRGLGHAKEQLHGSYKQSYNQLPSFCGKVVETNPGSFAKLTTDDGKKFKCLFVAFHCLIHGFQNGCRPLLFLESTSLRSKYQEFLLTANALDADDGIFPVAFAVVDVDNIENWRWFLEQVKSAISTSLPVTFVSDRDKGLKSTVLEIFENSYHGYSIFHLVESLKRDIKGPFHGDGKGVLPGIFLAAAHAVRLAGFEKFTEQIKQISSQAYDWVIQIEPECWTNLLFKGEPYNHFTVKIGECYSKLMEEVKESTIMHKIEALISMIGGWVKNRQTESSLWSMKLTPSREEKLKEDSLKARSYKVLFSSDTLAEVHDDCAHVVNIKNKDCTCLEWSANGLPCRHAIAVLNCKRRSLYEYCPKYFTAESFCCTYSESLQLIPWIDDPVRGEMEADTDSMQVLPPDPPKLTSEQKKELAKMDVVNRRTVTCTRCKEPGHNKASCKAIL